MAHTHHAIDYIELNATDVGELKRFYSAAFGWEFNDYGPDYAGIRGPAATARPAGQRHDSAPRTDSPPAARSSSLVLR